MNEHNDNTTNSSTSIDLLNTNYEDNQNTRQYGKICGWLQALFTLREDEVEQSVGRFEKAIDEEWPLVYGMTTSGAHGWQITTHTRDGERVDFDDNDADPDAPTYLEKGAYCDDVHWLVFENGWIHANAGRWIHDEETAERVSKWIDRAREFADEANESQREIFNDDTAVRFATDIRDQPMEAYGHHKPTAVEGTTRDVLNFSKGYRTGSSPTTITVETPGGTEIIELSPGESFETKHDTNVAVSVENGERP